MKNFFKKVCAYTFATFIAFLSMSCLKATAQSASTEEANVFNFIKSEGNIKDFVYDGTILLYGGIALIVISAIGIFLTLKPRKKRRKNKKRIEINRRS